MPVPTSESTPIGIFYHSDPAGHVPSGVDSFIGGILRGAPADLHYTLYGATSDALARPVGVPQRIGPHGDLIPLMDISPAAGRGLVPNTVRYVHALASQVRTGQMASLRVLDFHRIEPLWLFRNDVRPRNLVLHQDMSVLREPGCDIAWRHAPWLYEWFERRAFDLVARVSVVRESAVQRYRQLYPDIADRFAFIPTWYDSSRFGWDASAQLERAASRQQFRSRYGISQSAMLLISVGRLDSQKDPLLLLAAMRELLKRGLGVHLLIVGDGVDRAVVEREIDRTGLRPYVSVAGALPRTDIAMALGAADVFAMSSAYEGMPIAVLEALACGLPVASTDVGELRRIVRDGANGYLCRERTATALADAVAKVICAHARLYGQPCHDSVAEWRPERVLGGIYALHRAQAGALAAAA